MLTLKNMKNHFHTICNHKKYVFKNCLVAEIPVRGLIHDLSKFSPCEFFESVRYYQGNRSPIDACKEANGYSMAWLHHKGRNSHHYEYWQDNFDRGGTHLQMPYKDALEMVCDYLGAGMAYSENQGVPFSYSGELEWWHNKTKNPIAMHPQTKRFVEFMMLLMAEIESNKILKPCYSKKIYQIAEIEDDDLRMKKFHQFERKIRRL